MIWLALVPLAAAAALFWFRLRVRRVREFALLLHRAGQAEESGHLTDACAALDTAEQRAARLGRALEAGAARAVGVARARLAFKQGDLDRSATLTYELLQQARAAT
ncbi:MAG: hypothetical protein R2762_15620 [Bryobacteraceae bacterium]